MPDGSKAAPTSPPPPSAEHRAPVDFSQRDDADRHRDIEDELRRIEGEQRRLDEEQRRLDSQQKSTDSEQQRRLDADQRHLTAKQQRLVSEKQELTAKKLDEATQRLDRATDKLNQAAETLRQSAEQAKQRSAPPSNNVGGLFGSGASVSYGGMFGYDPSSKSNNVGSLFGNRGNAAAAGTAPPQGDGRPSGSGGASSEGLFSSNHMKTDAPAPATFSSASFGGHPATSNDAPAGAHQGGGGGSLFGMTSQQAQPISSGGFGFGEARPATNASPNHLPRGGGFSFGGQPYRGLFQRLLLANKLAAANNFASVDDFDARLGVEQCSLATNQELRESTERLCCLADRMKRDMLQRAALRGPEHLRDLEADLAAGEANPQAHLEAKLVRLAARSPAWTAEQQQRMRELSELALVDPAAAMERLRSRFRGTAATR